MIANPPYPVCVLYVCITQTCLFVSCESGGGATSNDRLWEGLSVCVVSDSRQGVNSMSERQRQIDWVKVSCYERNGRSAICDGTSMILSGNPPPPPLKIHVPNLFSPQDSTDSGLRSQTGWQSFSRPPNLTPLYPTPTQTLPHARQSSFHLGW